MAHSRCPTHGIRRHAYFANLTAACLGLRRGCGVAMEQEGPILVVEDQPELLELLGTLLNFERYRVALTADGQEAVDWLAHERPALVILEWLLPKVAGARVIAGTRERYGAHVPILVLSTVANSDMARRAGADAYMRKPYHINDLVGTIHQLLAA